MHTSIPDIQVIWVAGVFVQVFSRIDGALLLVIVLEALEDLAVDSIDCGDDKVEIDDEKNTIFLVLLLLLSMLGDFEIIIGLVSSGNSS